MSKADKVYTYVASQVAKLSVDTPGARADLGELRRAVGKKPIDATGVWHITMASDEIESEVGGSITKEGNAIHVALTLFALSKQGSGVQGCSFGEALARLAASGGMAYASIQTRFNKMIGTKDISKLSTHARGFIGLFNKAGIQLDYARLAKDLYNYQWPEGYKAVRVRWATEFYTKNKQNGGKYNEN